MHFAQETHSIWQESEPPFLPSLNSHEAADACVIGCGISGLTTAYKLLESGRSVVVLDRTGMQNGQTTLSSAHLCTALDERYFRLQQIHGKDGARIAAESHTFAITEIERICRDEAIDCEFMRTHGQLFLAPGDDEELLYREFEACKQVGLNGVELRMSGDSVLFPVGPSLRFPEQARFHPGLFLAGLARSIQKKGGKIYTHTEVTGIEGGRPARVSTNRGFQVICDSVVIATNSPFGDRLTLPKKMSPYRSYMIGLKIDKRRQDFSLFWDTAAPYHYIRTCFDSDGETILLIGGEDHRTGQDEEGVDHFQSLRSWARDRLGVEGDLRYHWSGQLLESHDRLALIGRSPGAEENVFVVTGQSGNGLTYGIIAAQLLADLITGRKNPWASLYDPSRINLRSLGTFLSENAKAAAPYSDWVTGGDVASLEEIHPGEGAIMREGIQKLAVYRDPLGNPHFFSAICPHMGGMVRWNGVEKTWDCPCHGSRFDRMGHLLNGPAVTGLKAVADTSVREEEAASA